MREKHYEWLIQSLLEFAAQSIRWTLSNSIIAARFSARVIEFHHSLSIPQFRAQNRFELVLELL
jgi:hypothetical protein